MPLPFVLTLIADRRSNSLNSEAIDIARTLVKGTAPVVLSEGEAVDIFCPAPGPGSASAATIRATLAPFRVDALLTKTRGRRKALLLADMDSTIVTGETLDELAALAGKGAEVAAITQAAMNGEIDFETALLKRVACLEGKSVSFLEEVWASLSLTDGARELVQTMKAHNAYTALVSGGFTWFTQRVAQRCGFDEHHGNVLEMHGDHLTGRLSGPVFGPDSKLERLESLSEKRRLRLKATLTTGDGANDIPMLRAAGMGIGFHGKPAVRQATELQVNFAGLRAHLFAQGYPSSSFVGD